MKPRLLSGATGISLFCLLLGSVSPQDAANAGRKSWPLDAGSVLRREISGSQVHEYPVAAASGVFLRFLIDKSNAALAISFLGPSGNRIREMYLDPEQYYPALLSHITEAPGIYRIEVRLTEKSAENGSYLIELAELCPATDQHRNRTRAERMLEAADAQVDREAEDATRTAAAAMEEAILVCRGAGDEELLSIALFQAASAQFMLGDLQRALAFLRQRQELARAHDEPVREADTVESMSIYARQLGGFQVALDSAVEALNLYRAAGDKAGEFNGLLGLAFAYQNLKEPGRAAEAFDQAAAFHPFGNGISMLSRAAASYYNEGQKETAIDRYETAAQRYASTGARGSEAAMLLQSARIYLEIGQRKKALGNVNRALSFWQSQNSPQPGIQALWLLGIIFNGLGDRQSAEGYLDRAFAAGDTKLDPGAAKSWSDLGVAYSNVGEREKARSCYEEALRIGRGLHRPEVQCLPLAMLAMDERDRGNTAAACALIEQALSNLEMIRGQIASPDMRSSYFAKTQNYYEFYVDLLMRMDAEKPGEGFQAAALKACERARARSLLALLSEGEVDIRQGVDAVVLEKELLLSRRLNNRADRLRALMSRPRHSPQEEQDLVREIDRLTFELEQVGGQIRASSPRYAAITMPAPLSVEEIQQQVLDDDTLLLEYALGDERSYLWVVSRDRMASFTLPPRAEVETAAQHVYELLTARNRHPAAESATAKRNRLEKAQAEYPAAAAQLSRLVLGPAAPLLGTRRLAIVPQGALQYIPFSSLPDPRSNTGKSWLMARHEIIYLPSASVLPVLRREISARKPAPKALAVLADPVFDKDDTRVQGNADPARAREGAVPSTSKRRPGTIAASPRRSVALERSLGDAQPDASAHLPRLPFSRREAEAIAGVVPKELGFQALDFLASRLTATNSNLGQYRIVHFATHGLIDSKHPELSGVVLSLVDERGAPQDGFLRLHDIYNLNLPADLVVLSACRTALGKEVQGEGLIGLTRGFMYAGAATVAASLWNVDDAATAELMARFYRNMFRQGQRPAAALRAAQREMSRQRRWQDPYYWASFQVQGEWK